MSRFERNENRFHQNERRPGKPKGARARLPRPLIIPLTKTTRRVHTFWLLPTVTLAMLVVIPASARRNAGGHRRAAAHRRAELGARCADQSRGADDLGDGEGDFHSDG